MPRQQHQLDASKECQINLAVEALKQDPKLSQRRAAAIYKVPQSTLSARRAGRLPRVNYMPVSRGLNNNEEQVIVKHILHLVKRGFPPRLLAVADIANSLRAERGRGYVSLN